MCDDYVKALSQQDDCSQVKSSATDPEISRPSNLLEPREIADSATHQGLEGTGDAVVMYLEKITQLPPLNQSEEIALAELIEVTRKRFRRRVLRSEYALGKIVETLKSALPGDLLPIGRAVEVTGAEFAEKDRASQRMRDRLSELEQLVVQNHRDFTVLHEPHTTEGDNNALQRSIRTRRRRMAMLSHELPVRTQQLESLTSKLDQISDRMGELDRLSKQLGDQWPTDIRGAVEQELRELIFKMHAEPRSLRKLVKAMKRRFAEFVDAKRALAGGNLRLVVRIAADYVDRGRPWLDLVQIGNDALMLATDTFDHRRDCQFSEYATARIENAMIQALAGEQPGVTEETANCQIDRPETLTLAQSEIISGGPHSLGAQPVFFS